MTVGSEELKGTNKNKSLSNNYWIYCFQEGKFIHDLTIEEMIGYCLLYVDEFNTYAEKNVTEEGAIE